MISHSPEQYRYFPTLNGDFPVLQWVIYFFNTVNAYWHKMSSLINKMRIKTIPVYPILFGIFPVLYLWNANRVQVPAYVIIPPLLMTLAGLVVVFMLSLAVTPNIHRAALLTSVVNFFLLTYGHFANLINSRGIAIQPAELLLITGLLALFFLLLILTRRLGSPTLSSTLNLISAGLVVLQLVSAAPYYLQMAQVQRVSAAYDTDGKPVPLTGSLPPRDIYFILLDNYGREDILREGSNFDNSKLVSELEQRGFLFPDCAQANYMATAPSITSILNMEYLDTLGIQERSYIRRGGYDDMAPLIQNSEVLRKFETYGYHTVTFRGFMGLIDIQNVDTYINFEQETVYSKRLETRNFESLYFETTIFPQFNEQFRIYPEFLLARGPEFLKDWIRKQQEGKDVLEPRFQQVYEQNLYAFDALRNIPTRIESPKFVYAHIYSAHWPFMMRPDGSLRLPFTQEQTVDGYVDAVRYTNSQILDAIDAILENSDPEPVIILQGDHSNEWTRPVEWGGKDRLKILLAYYLPDGGDELLYDKISPVNNFRLIFSHYFGEDLDLLRDRHYYLNPETRRLARAAPTCMSDSLEAQLPASR